MSDDRTHSRINVQRDDRSAALEERTDGCSTDSRCTTGHQCNFTGELGRLACKLEFCLLEVPVLDIENVARGQRLVFAERRGTLNDLDIMFVELARDDRVAIAASRGT